MTNHENYRWVAYYRVSTQRQGESGLGLEAQQAAFAEEEARRISVRTKEALAAAKRRGVEIGATGRVRAVKLKEEARLDAENYRTLIEELYAEGFERRRAIAGESFHREVGLGISPRSRNFSTGLQRQRVSPEARKHGTGRPPL